MTNKHGTLRAESHAALGSVYLLVATMCLSFASLVHATTWEDETGPYSTTIIERAGPGHAYYIHRPATLKAGGHPVAVLCAGTATPPRDYDPLLSELASHGVVVIADAGAFPDDASKHSAAVDWLLQENETVGSEYFGKLVTSKVLAIGHSAGARGAVAAAILNPRITSVLLYAPSLLRGRSAELTVPAFFISGSLDTLNPPADVKARYQETIKGNAWFGDASNQGHNGFQRNTSVKYFTRAWVYTNLFDDSGARGCFYGPNWSLKNAPAWNEALKNNAAP